MTSSDDTGPPWVSTASAIYPPLPAMIRAVVMPLQLASHFVFRSQETSDEGRPDSRHLGAARSGYPPDLEICLICFAGEKPCLGWIVFYCITLVSDLNLY
jgi:hypothetical protein